ncbi:MAG TPA: MarR family winged helix-turn-helix transcriptional regulator [Patescibacteria group bacterium]|nr:MarR family winged helix-turn-helix transcriptional regulator [Patescibacteria group bacterium]
MNNVPDFEQLFASMLQLSKLISQYTQETREERIATVLQFSALNLVKDQHETAISDISKSLQLSKSSATQLIERLVKLGLVKRISDPEDRRIIRLEITKNGDAELHKLRLKLINKMKRVFSKIPAKDIRELIRIHTNLIETLKTEHI